jgi:hypothetical protein
MLASEITSRDAAQIWRNNLIPVIYKPTGAGSLLVRVPYADDNRDWLLGEGRQIRWLGQFRAWEIPRSRFEDMVARMLWRYAKTYVIQAFRHLEKCAPACWNAMGYDCECSCLGANHGSGQALTHVVSETFAFDWGERRLACRLLERKV